MPLFGLRSPRYLSQVPDAVWIVLFWSVLFLPNLATRSLYFEEGRIGLAARDILEHGTWIRPQVLGLSYDKAPLYAWLIAAVARVTGNVNEWSVWLPALLAVLLGGLIVHGFTRRQAGRLAARVATAAFFLAPLTVLSRSRSLGLGSSCSCSRSGRVGRRRITTLHRWKSPGS